MTGSTRRGDEVDWRSLDRLRRAFLAGTAGHADYWQSEDDLESYDATFAQRIGWKWDFVLEDLRERGWCPPGGEVLDWGCGSGIAGRAFLDHFGTDGVSRVRFFDRSAMASRYAVRRAAVRFPGLDIGTGAPEKPAVLLISHVLTELDSVQVEQLVARARNAASVLWVEPGTYDASLALIAVRERLRDQFHPVAPCPHRETCGILAPGNESHWCHQFAVPPPGVFTDPFWGRFASLLQIDLRSVPLSYLVLDCRRPPPLPDRAVRRLGRARVTKAEARLFGCDVSGVRERAVSRRDRPDFWQDARRDRLPSLLSWPGP